MKMPLNYGLFTAMLCLVMLFSSVQTQGLSRRPRITPPEGEVLFMSGSNFTLVCEADNPVNWSLPIDYQFKGEHLETRATFIDTFDPTGDYRYKSVLTIRDSMYLDTGEYVCHYNTAVTTEPTQDAAIFVYVHDGINLMALNVQLHWLDVTLLDTIRIPCIGTHPNVTVRLYNAHDNALLNDWEYNRHKGFSKIASDLNGGTFFCVAMFRDASTTSDHIDVIIMPLGALPKPTISPMHSQYVKKGGNFSLLCSVVFERQDFNLRWETPWPATVKNNRTRIETESSEGPTLNKYTLRSRLTVTNASTEDSGQYSCVAQRKDDYEKEFVSVSIHDDSFTHLNLSVNPPESSRLTVIARTNVTWVIEVHAFPYPAFTWVTPDKTIVNTTNSDKYIMTKNISNFLTLSINDVSLHDAGVYQLRARNDGGIKNLNLTLVVKGKPEVEMDSPESNMNSHLYLQNVPFTIRCHILAHPLVNQITVLYRNSPSEGDGDTYVELGSKSADLANSERILTGPIARETILRITGYARIQREYSCKACNTEGCITSSSYTVTITDVPDGFKLDLSVEQPSIGDQVALTCTVSISIYEKRLRWLFVDHLGNQRPLQPALGSFSNGFVFRSNNTAYSYSETLYWPSISESANGTYVCTADPLDGEPAKRDVTFAVLRPAKPIIKNWSPIQQTFDLGTPNVTLQCEAYGLPKPLVTWLKDGQPFQGARHDEVNTTQLTFSYLSSQDSGTYTCTYSNRLGEDSKTLKLSVKVPVNKGIVAAVVVVAIIVVALLTLLGFKMRKERKRKAFFRLEQLKRFEAGDPASINPELGVDEQAELLPYDSKWEFPRERLKLGKQLGAGAFGRVVKGEAFNMTAEESVTVVAVKMVKSHANQLALKALMSELKIMIHLGSHLNVVNLLGACTKNVAKGELLVIVEFCRYGNLQSFLIRHRDVFVDQVDRSRGVVDFSIGCEFQNRETNVTSFTENSGKSTPLLTTSDKSFVSMNPTAETVVVTTNGIDSSGQVSTTGSQAENAWPFRGTYIGERENTIERIYTKDLICWAYQTARGMDYLTSRKVMHGDLAARNVLLADNKIVKIADFGLAREVYHRTGNYKKKGDGPLPIKWMAPESIVDRNFSSQSDVWAFGILLWELFSLGKTPYPGIEPDEVFVQRVLDGYRMERAKFASDEVHRITQDCWHNDPKKRPTFSSLEETIGNLLDTALRRQYIELNMPYLKMNEQLGINSSNDYLSMMGRPNYMNLSSASPTEHDYVNTSQIPQMENKTSDYLNMGPGQHSGYLFMTGATKKAEVDTDVDETESSKPRFGQLFKRTSSNPDGDCEMIRMLDEPSFPTHSQSNQQGNSGYVNEPLLLLRDDSA